MLSIGMRFLDFTNRWLRYGQEAALPFFVLHQPAIVAIGFFVLQWELGILPKLLILVATPFSLSLGLYELVIRRVRPPLWHVVSEINEELKEEIGWPELVETVAGIYAALPAEERPHTGIWTGNYGEAGAINLYGPAYGLPTAISGVNSYWLRGYGDPPPRTVIVIGLAPGTSFLLFDSCTAAGRITNRYDVMNDEAEDTPVILVCRDPRLPWPELWEHLQSFG